MLFWQAQTYRFNTQGSRGVKIAGLGVKMVGRLDVCNECMGVISKGSSVVIVVLGC